MVPASFTEIGESATGTATAPDSETLTLDVYYYKTNAAAATVGELSSNVTYTISYL